MEGASYNTTAFINAYRTTQSQSLETSSNGMCVFLQHVARRHRWWWLWHDSSRHCIRGPPTTSTAPPLPLLHPTHYGFISTILTIGRRNPLQINTIANSESIGYCLFHSQRHVYCWDVPHWGYSQWLVSLLKWFLPIWNGRPSSSISMLYLIEIWWVQVSGLSLQSSTFCDSR